MTDDWDFYFLRVDDKPASIYLDLGAAASAPNMALPHLAYVKLYMNSPRDDGLSSREEFDALVVVEDALKSRLIGADADYVGRCTTDSCRDFFFYVAQPERWTADVEACMKAFAHYRYEVDTQEERNWDTYFSYLHPGDEDMERITNRRVCQALERKGDKLTEPREIDHWAYFEDETSMAAYVAATSLQGYAVRVLSGPDDDSDRHCAQLWRVDVPSYMGIDEVTLPLLHLAGEHGGRYDGWECVLVS